MLNLVFEKLDNVPGNSARGVVFGCVGLGLVGIVRFNNGDDLLRVDGDVRGSNSVLWGPLRLLVEE